jgi:hypothetical protein
MALTQVQSGILADSTQTYGMKNRIINGDMRIDQRNAGASVNITNNAPTYTVDRWLIYSNNDGACSVQQVTDAPTGFVKSLKVTTATADASLSSTQRVILLHRFEGFNTADFAWGTANAKAVTLSFWVKSTLTGMFGAAIQNADVNRAYPFSYTINAANTWEYKTVTISGDTTGTWAVDNTQSLRLTLGLGVGSTYNGTAGSWTAADINSVTSATSLIGTLGATWQITGVQLEVGSTATAFDYRQYGTELLLCQRYFWQTNASGQSNGEGTGMSGVGNGTTALHRVNLPTRITMRVVPSLVFSNLSGNGTDLRAYNGSAVNNVTSPGTNYSTRDTLQTDFSLSGSFTAGQYISVLWIGTVLGYIRADAEL